MGTVGAGGAASPLIRIEGLQKIYAANTASPVHALSSIDLDIADGEFVAWSDHRAAARAPCCGFSPGWTRYDAGGLTLDGQAGDRAVGQGRRRVPGRESAAWLTRARERAPAAARGRRHDAADHRIDALLEMTGLADFGASLSV